MAELNATMAADDRAQDRADDRRFGFGANWQRFLQTINQDSIAEAEHSFLKMLDLPSVKGLSLLDIGSGSGLSSLVARQLGMKVYSFDYDSQSVECTKRLKKIYFPGDENWKITQGSALDQAFLQSLGQFDVVSNLRWRCSEPYHLCLSFFNSGRSIWGR